MKRIPPPRNRDGSRVKVAGFVELRARITEDAVTGKRSERIETRLFTKVIITTNVTMMLMGIRYVLANDWANQNLNMISVYWPPNVPYSDYGKSPDPGYEVEMKPRTMYRRDQLLAVPPGTEFGDIHGVYNYICNTDRTLRRYARMIKKHGERLRRESAKQQAVVDAQAAYLAKRVAAVILEPDWRQKALRTVSAKKP